MRRIINNTTAIAACLSLLTPHIAMAQEATPDSLEKQLETLVEQAKEGAEAETAPEPEPAPEVEPEAAPDTKPEITPEAAPEAKPEIKPEPAPEAEPVECTEAVTDAEKAAACAEPVPDTHPAAETAAEKPADSTETTAPEEQAEKPAEKSESLKAEEAATEANTLKAEDEMKAAGEAKAAEQKKTEQNQTAGTEPAAISPEPGVRLANTEVAKQRAEAMAGLNKVLIAEVESGLTTSQLKCLSGAEYPCPEGGLAITPKGVVLQPLKDDSFILAAWKEQMYRVNKDGEIVERAAEEGAVETAAAKEAADATLNDAVAALTSDSGQGELVEQEVTEENSRSSSEDFTGNLRDALAAANGQQAATETGDDDDDNDLTKALLLGLGAIAAGSMLSNNREVALSTPDRVVVTRADGSQEVIKDETALLREPGANIVTDNFDDGSSRTVVVRANGSKVVTIRDADLRVLRRTLIDPDGTETALIDDTAEVDPVNIASLPNPAPLLPESAVPLDEDALRAALQREADIGRRFTLAQIRNIPQVRALVAPVNIDAVTFETGSAAINPDQAQQLATLGTVIQDAIRENPREIFLIEGHTDTVGSDAMNLALSDRRAESVALALSEYFDVPPENLVVQGYGEQYLKIRSEGDIRENRRASVRRITELLQTAAAQ